MATNLKQVKEALESSEKIQKEKWRSIWKLKIIPKAKIDLWKIIKNPIPTKDNLAFREMDIKTV